MLKYNCLDRENEEYLRLIVCSVSIAAGIFVIILCLLPKLLEKTTKKVIFFLALNSIVRCTLEIIAMDAHGWLCLIISYSKNIFLISNVIWSGFIAKTLDNVVTNQGEYNPRYFLFTLLLSYIIVPSIELLPFITNSYDSEICGGLKYDLIGLIWRNTIVYLPCFSIIIVTLVYYARMYRFFKKRGGEIELSGLLIDRGLLYSILFIFLFLLLFSVRIMEYIHESKGTSCFRLAGSIYVYLQGIIVMIITLAREDIKEKVFCKKPQRSESTESYLNFLIN
jgi:hypothetical protein